MASMTICRAFTLVELLIVLAILAILSAVLFPVFAQAKLSANKTTDLANLRQIGQAAMIYESDFDEGFPTYVASFCPGALVPNPVDQSNGSGGRHPMWQYEIEPYIRSWGIYFAPADTIPTNPVARFHNLSYAYNYGYLSKLELTPDPAGCGIDGWFSGKSTASVSSPSATIAFVDGGGAATFKETPSYFGDLVNPPDASHSTELFYGLPEAGWGVDCQNYYADTPFAVTDGFSARYFAGGNLAFVDGHTGYVKTNNAAAGTDFSPMISCLQTKVTDNTKYLWDPRGASAPLE